MAIQDLDDFLEKHPSFEKKKKLLIMSDLFYKPTSEKVSHGGFRYFECGIDDLLALFRQGDFAAIAKLPFSFDDDGDPDTSAVRLDLAYTASGSMVAAQPVEFQNYNPTPVAEVLFLEGDAAKRVAEHVASLDQTG